MKFKKGGWKYLFVSFLAGISLAIALIAIGAPHLFTNALPAGLSAAIAYGLKNKWMV